jgi:hypothetical protein
MQRPSLAGAFVSAVVASAYAQVVPPHQSVSITSKPSCPMSSESWEPAIAVSRTNGNRLLVTWRTGALPWLSRRNYYAISKDGGQTFACPLELLVASDPEYCAAFMMSDPTVEALQSGEFLVGGITTGQPGSGTPSFIAFSRVPADTEVAEPARQIYPCAFGAGDKPWAAAGPWPADTGPHDTQETVYVGWHNHLEGGMFSAHCTDRHPVGHSWQFVENGEGYPQPVLHTNGSADPKGAYPVVMRSGLQPGRVILAYSNLDRMRITTSPDGGDTWAPGHVVEAFVPHGTENPQLLLEIAHGSSYPHTGWQDSSRTAKCGSESDQS